MELQIPFGNQTIDIEIDLPASQILVARSRNPSGTRGWADVVAEAIRAPVGAGRMSEQDLRGKRVAIITDDWGRPTPASEVIPLILEELKSTGVRDDDITFVTASGMHAPMSETDLARKLGDDAVSHHTCVSHDGGDWSSLRFYGVSPQGTPVWINRHVADADFRIAVGRIFPHEAYGYEGGYKIILPGVSGFDTITRDHSLNFSPDCYPGNHDNPARREADAVGQMVGVDLLINAVVNELGQPVKAFCGEPMEVHRIGIAYGDSEVWGAEVGRKADVVIASPGAKSPADGCDTETLYRAALVTKERGLVICLAEQGTGFVPQEGNGVAEESLRGGVQSAFREALPSLAFSELFRLHEKRDWPLPEREIQYRIKAVRGEFYRRRGMREIQKRRVALTLEPSDVLRRELACLDKGSARVIVLPEARTTLAKEKLFRA